MHRQSKAQEELDKHLLYFASQIAKLSPSLLKVEARKYAAIISFAYNCGVGNYRISTLKKRIDAGDWAGAQEEIMKWNKAAGRVLAGLTKRRQAEASLLS
jgi:lysozyme